MLGRINVVFTDLTGTAAALRSAATMTKDLRLELALIVAQLVPYPLPLTAPPVPVSFRIAQIRELIDSTGTYPDVEIYLCRDPVQALLKLLTPDAPAVIGVKEGWLPTPGSRLAHALERTGHQITLAWYR
jgi:hypothetical protein